MLIEFPKEIQELMNVYKPYMVNHKFVKDTPQEAIEAFEKVKKWAWEQGQ